MNGFRGQFPNKRGHLWTSLCSREVCMYTSMKLGPGYHCQAVIVKMVTYRLLFSRSLTALLILIKSKPIADGGPE